MKSLYFYRITKIWFKYILALVFHYLGVNHLLLNRAKNTYILMLHRISGADDILNISITPKNLSAAIDWCEQLGCIRDMDSLFDRQDTGVRFAITFDDGYSSVLKALELPKIVPMTVYLSTGFIETNRSFWATYIESLLMKDDIAYLDLSGFDLGVYKLAYYGQRRNAILVLNRKMKALHPNKIHEVINFLEDKFGNSNASEFLNWHQVKQLSDAGITIGSHTHNHAITSRLSKMDFEQEMQLSHELIEQKLGQEVQHFAYPNGQAQDIAPFCHEILRQKRFDTAVTTIEGGNAIDQDTYMLKRFNLSNERMENPWGKPSMAMFTSMLTNPLSIY